MRIFFLHSFSLLFAAAHAQDSSAVKTKGSYVFDVNSGLIISNAISNFSQAENYNKGYWQIPNKPICLGYSGGVDLILGKKENAKHFFGVSYGLTNSTYADEYDSHPFLQHYPVYDRHKLIYTKQYQTIDLSYGAAFHITKKLNYVFAFSYSYVFKQMTTQTGYVVSESYSPYGYQYDSTYYPMHQLPKSGYNSYLSFRSKLSYDFSIGTSKFAAFVAGNLALRYRLPWIMIGLQYYPFRKMQ
jgi:hypothetical protein